MCAIRQMEHKFICARERELCFLQLPCGHTYSAMISEILQSLEIPAAANIPSNHSILACAWVLSPFFTIRMLPFNTCVSEMEAHWSSLKTLLQENMTTVKTHLCFVDEVSNLLNPSLLWLELTRLRHTYYHMVVTINMLENLRSLLIIRSSISFEEEAHTLYHLYADTTASSVIYKNFSNDIFLYINKTATILRLLLK